MTRLALLSRLGALTALTALTALLAGCASGPPGGAPAALPSTQGPLHEGLALLSSSQDQRQTAQLHRRYRPVIEDRRAPGVGDKVMVRVGAADGAITTMVIDVMPQGRLVLRGRLRMASPAGMETVRFSGVVSPTALVAGNTVSAAAITDARIECGDDSQLDQVVVTGWLQRVFVSSVAP